MKKLVLSLLTLTALSGFTLSAQSYTITPSNHLDGTVDPGGATDLTIYFENMLAGNLAMDWMKIDSNYNPFWTVQVCDNVTCIDPIIGDTQSMAPIAAGDHGFLKALFTPNGYTGTGTIWLTAWERGSSTPDTVSFTVTSIVGIDDAHLLKGISLSPNPAADQVRLSAENGILQDGTISIFSLNGQLVKQVSTTTQSSVSVDVYSLNPGMYIIQYTNTEGLFRDKFVKL